MNKTILIMAVFSLLVVGVVSAASVGYMKAEYTGKNVRVYGNVLEPAPYQLVEVYCTHNNVTYNVGNETINDGKKDLSKDTFRVQSRDTGCVKNDYAWIVMGDYESQLLKIKRHHRHSEPVQDQAAIAYEQCKTDALTWYEEHRTQPCARALYQLKLRQCDSEFKKVQPVNTVLTCTI